MALTTTPSAAHDQAFAALRSLIARYWGRFTLATMVRALASAIPALHPYFVAELASSVDEPERAGTFLILLFATGAIHGALWSGGDLYISAKIQPVTYEFKKLTFDAVWSEEYQTFVDRPSGKVASYVNDMRNQVEALWQAAHFGFTPVIATLPVYVVLLWRTSSGNSWVYIVFPMLVIVLMGRAGRLVDRRQRKLTNSTSDNTGRVFDSYANFANVFSFRSQRKEIARHDEQLDAVVDDAVSFAYGLSLYWFFATVLGRVVLWGVVLGFGWYRFDQGQVGLAGLVVTVTVLIDFTYQYWNLLFNVKEWIDQSARFREAYNYVFPGRNIVADPPAPLDSAPHSVGSGRSDGRTLEVANLSFAYPDDPERLVLDDVSFTLAPGERLGIVGRSGEGKSTLIKILLGFYEPTAGQVRLDGEPATASELGEIQSYVPQDTTLFQETIEYNIGYAEAGPVDHERIREAARRANIADFIEDLPQGYQTLVGERGVKLSLGQRQRIAIARAFLRESELVILDEATSALDSETEAYIQESLDELWQGKSAIMIAHRLATLNDVDRILVIENGKIAESGSKDELLAQPGRFADMWGLQRDSLR